MYMAADCESSLLRNGKVYTQRDATGNDLGTTGVRKVAVPVSVRNAREMDCQLATHGFEKLDNALDTSIDFLVQDDVVSSSSRAHLAQCSRIYVPMAETQV
jgi:hypothetical protein